MVTESKRTEPDAEFFTQLSSMLQSRTETDKCPNYYLCNINLSVKFSGFYSILIPVKTHSASACGTYAASDECLMKSGSKIRISPGPQLSPLSLWQIDSVLN